jgi:hypothetical protein
MLMKCLRGFFCFVVCVCLSPSPMALAQASTVNSPTGLVTPSLISVQSDSAITKKTSPKPIRSHASGSEKSMLPYGAVPKASSTLVFQPGIGWQHAPQVSSAHAVIANSGTSGAFAPSSGSSKNSLDEYRSSSTSVAAIGDFKSGQFGKPTQTSNVLPDSSSNMSLGVRKGSPGSFSQRNGSSDSFEPVHEFAHRAYISPIEIRRQMRDEPDLKTRIKLRKLNEKLTSQHAKNSDTDQKRQDKKMIANGIVDLKSMSQSERRAARRKSGSHDTHVPNRLDSHKSL